MKMPKNLSTILMIFIVVVLFSKLIKNNLMEGWGVMQAQIPGVWTDPPGWGDGTDATSTETPTKIQHKHSDVSLRPRATSVQTSRTETPTFIGEFSSRNAEKKLNRDIDGFKRVENKYCKPSSNVKDSNLTEYKSYTDLAHAAYDCKKVPALAGRNKQCTGITTKTHKKTRASSYLLKKDTAGKVSADGDVGAGWANDFSCYIPNDETRSINSYTAIPDAVAVEDLGCDGLPNSANPTNYRIRGRTRTHDCNDAITKEHCGKNLARTGTPWKDIWDKGQCTKVRDVCKQCNA